MGKGGHEKGGWAAAVQELCLEEEREREREREFLVSLRYVFSSCLPLCSLTLTNFCRSPDIETHENHRGSIGGWGLGNPHEVDTTKKHVVEDEDDEMDWDQAQDVVERMVGMKVNESGHGDRR